MHLFGVDTLSVDITLQCPAEMQVDSGFFMLNNDLESQCFHGRGEDLCRECD